jgi:hypothetical protein
MMVAQVVTSPTESSSPGYWYNQIIERGGFEFHSPEMLVQVKVMTQRRITMAH